MVKLFLLHVWVQLLLRGNKVTCELGVKGISGPFGHLLHAADGGREEVDVATCCLSNVSA